MNRIRKSAAIVVAWIMLITAGSPWLRGDSLTTVDGVVIVGAVTQIANGYKIVTTNGTVTIAADRVKNVTYDQLPTAPPTSKPAPVPTAKPADAREVAALTQQGLAAMAANEFADARDTFSDLLLIDPKNPTAARGLGFAYLKLEKPSKAVKPLLLAAMNPPLDRALTMALAASLLATHDPMRGAQFVKTYLEAHPKPLDEPVINALGTSLSRADSAAAKSASFAGGVKLYDQFNTELESRHPGQKRWGVEWGDADTVDRKSEIRQVAQKKVEDAWTRLQSASTQLTAAQAELTGASNYSLKKATHDQKVQAAQGKVNAATSAVEKAQIDFDKADKALAEVPGPIWPGAIVLEDGDMTMPPPPAHAVVTRYAAGFAVAPNILVTAAWAVEDAAEIQITTSDGKTMKAEIARVLHGEGLALLRINDGHLPSLPLASRPSGGSLTCIGFPDVELFHPVTRQLNVSGNDPVSTWVVSFGISPRLPGAPLIKNGALVGVELADRDSDLSQVPAANLNSLLNLVENQVHANPAAQDPAQAIVLVSASR